MAQEQGKLSLTFALGETDIENNRKVNFLVNGHQVRRDDWLALNIASGLQAIRSRLEKGIPILLAQDPDESPIVDPSIIFPKGG